MIDIRSISPSTQFCMVIGDPIAHSLSPAIHNAGYAELGLDFVYLACRVENVQNAIAGMRSLDNFRGMSVTIPHKVEVMKYVDEMAAVDRSIGAINTVVHDSGGKVTGLNTDGPGALKAIEDAGVDLKGKHVLMLGAGGAARAIAFTLAWDNRLAELKLLDIDAPVLTELTTDLSFGTQANVASEVMTDKVLSAAMATADVIIHCTPIGMHPKEDASLVPPALFRSGQVVFDIVYTPLKTKLLADAAAKGLQTISGVEMFVNQAVLQFERFTGVQAPEQVMHRVVMEHFKQ
jgi:shikimate dehydrogenase